MSLVRVLPDGVIDRIKAGEVVDRPASVLKELLENALDAGAATVEVRLLRGGKGLVEVVDDGCGMDADDALLCVERHATSKLRSEGDLVGIGTHGFRGEALPSIGAVSRMVIRTRRAEAELGTRVVVEGGSLNGAEPDALAPGTEVSVRDLFFNMPVRQGFLKTTQTELDHCTEALRRAFMLRPDVGVRLHHDGRALIDAPATDALPARVRSLIGDDARQLIEVAAERGRRSLTGLVSPPGIFRATGAEGLYTYVNGRYVRDPVVRRAVMEAYRGAIPQGRRPIVVLAVQVPGDEVDVNVHPQKTQVRFRHPAEVSGLVVDAIRDALREGSRRVVQPGEVRPPRAAGPGLDAMPQRGLFDASSGARGAPSPSGAERDGTGTEPSSPTSHVARAVADVAPAASPPLDPEHGLAPSVRPPDAPAPSVVAEPPPTAASPARAAASASVGTAAPRKLPIELWGVVGERYAVGAGHRGLAIADLARLAGLLLQARIARGEEVGRPLLAPQVVKLPAAPLRVVIEGADALSELGVEVSAYGPGELAVLSLPDAIPTDAASDLLIELAARLPDTAACAEVLLQRAASPARTVHAARTLLAEAAEAGVAPHDYAQDLDASSLGAWLQRL